MPNKIFFQAFKDSFLKFSPRQQIKNPVIFVTLLGALLLTLQLIGQGFNAFDFQIAFWLWVTVWFANFSESLAEGRGKAQAEALKKNRQQLSARLLNGKVIPASGLKKGDKVVCETNDFIPGDGDVIEGIASVDESAITGESAPVIRESGGDRSAVTAGTRVISDRIVIRITAEPGQTFLDRMVSLIEGASRQKTPNEIALSMVLFAMTLLFFVVVSSFKIFNPEEVSVSILVALFVCLIPTTIGGLLSAVGIAGMDRLLKKNVIAKSGRAVEAAGDVDVMLLDKTGTITLGNRMAAALIPEENISMNQLALATYSSSLSDETPEGRSIIKLIKEQYPLSKKDLNLPDSEFIPFSAKTRLSGVNIGKKQIRKGAIDSIEKILTSQKVSPKMTEQAAQIARAGATPLAVAEDGKLLGLIHLKDTIKSGIKDRFGELRKMGIRTVMITGDNPLTAAAIAVEAGVDDFIAEATPEMKLKYIRDAQSQGKLVAMTGDGTNDAPALAQADVGVVMNSGTQAAREAGNMIDLDSSPTKLIEVVTVGKQMLMTRGALTTFSFANDFAKYFAILPAVCGPSLSVLNIMQLHSPQTAVLSAIIFNALIIVLLIPLALRGVNYQAENAGVLLRRNLLIYGLGGLIAPFIGIKLIDVLVSLF